MTGRYTVVGIDDSVTVCDCCGRPHLVCTVMLQPASGGEVVHYGRSCAARALGRSTTGAALESLERVARTASAVAVLDAFHLPRIGLPRHADAAARVAERLGLIRHRLTLHPLGYLRRGDVALCDSGTPLSWWRANLANDTGRAWVWIGTDHARGLAVFREVTP